MMLITVPACKLFQGTAWKSASVDTLYTVYPVKSVISPPLSTTLAT
nr:hypothetical protein [bacterium]